MNKTNEQLHQEFEEALDNLSKKLYDLLHYGTYELKDLDRAWDGPEIRYARMDMNGCKMFLHGDDEGGTSVELKLPNNPVNQELIDNWDRLTIDNDISYHASKLSELIAHKNKLNKK